MRATAQAAVDVQTHKHLHIDCTIDYYKLHFVHIFMFYKKEKTLPSF